MAGAARVAVALAVVLALAARILAVSEAVTGLVLIGWTASYTLAQMSVRCLRGFARLWKRP